ncbi:MAG: hypothetical protein FD145_275 [Candidatus Saganbacteria bacterium]|uniref:Uncharacterized protein n=1 Tax=Candidatus Saganbacteria bacterium TaxID=2575572 RepID=A0A833NZ52_UNCSA|nr:MAG: hypothetical protein FD145_275 [Candidatus Saganbacteria bacterium]
MREKQQTEEFVKILREIAERYRYVIDTVGTVDDGRTEESIKQYIEKQGKEDKHARFEQMRMFKL